MTVYGTLQSWADQLTAAGVRATCDPADAHAPCVLLVPTGVEPDGAVTVDVAVLPGPALHAGLRWAWDTALPLVAGVCGWSDVRTDRRDDGSPAVVVRTQLATWPASDSGG